MSELIRYEVNDGIGVLTINRPEKRNAMTYAMLGEFIAAVGDAGKDAGNARARDHRRGRRVLCGHRSCRIWRRCRASNAACAAAPRSVADGGPSSIVRSP